MQRIPFQLGFVLLACLAVFSGNALAQNSTASVPAKRDSCIYNPSWTSCNTDKECTVIPGVCGFWDGVVNKESVPAARVYFKCQGDMGGCKKPTAATNPKPKVACVANTCIAVSQSPRSQPAAKSPARKQKAKKKSSAKKKSKRKFPRKKTQ